jgi:hypothetical protein
VGGCRGIETKQDESDGEELRERLFSHDVHFIFEAGLVEALPRSDSTGMGHSAFWIKT